MSGERRFPPEKIASLDAPERELHQPAAPLVDLVAAWGPRAILDLGVGTGYFALPLCARLPGARVIGLDAEARMLEALAGRAEAAGCAGALESIEAGAELIPLPDSSVDVVLMVNLY
ncbi:MAG: class I SAM-dependent methyltransferase, partial [Polyangia bacterium]|nr:class I SAM-dependent methyltransferase [Polyangia bacterium]